MALKDHYHVVLGSRNNAALRKAEGQTGCDAYPLDVVNVNSVRDVFNEIKPNIVIHAAATKYVDWSERHPLECLDVNIVGSQNVARTALNFGTELVIGVSTDKASRPLTSTYGLSKAAMERLFCGLDTHPTPTRFACVRYGNVVWSTGSVFHAWRAMGANVVSTGPKMRRFFFTVDDAVNLVTTCIGHIEQLRGTVLSQPMKAAQVCDVLNVWTELFGGAWVQGESRPGDADDECLVNDVELSRAREVILDARKYYVIGLHVPPTGFPLVHAPSSANAVKLTHAEIRTLLTDQPALP